MITHLDFMEQSMPATYISTHDMPSDCNRNPLRVGMTVYLPDGWNGDTPRPWVPAVIKGISFIGGTYYLDLEGVMIHQCAARSVSTRNPYPPNAKISGHAPTEDK
jgi:hypothetical protein